MDDIYEGRGLDCFVVLMGHLEFNLQLLQFLIQLLDLRVPRELLWNFNGHHKFGQIGSFLQGSQILEEEVVYGVDDFLIPIEKPILPIGPEL